MSCNSVVDKQVTLIKKHFPESLLDYLRKYVSFKNPAKEMAQKEHLYNWWKMEDYIDLWSEDEKNFYIPRGFAFQELRLEGILDKRINKHVNYKNLAEVNLRAYQEIACREILEQQQGVWVAPPGAGKTTTTLEAIRRSGQRALIIVDKTNIAEQWRERAQQFLQKDIGLIGDGVYNEQDITVVLQQTLWARKDSLIKKGFFDAWGFVVVDECHHVTADTFQQIISEFSSFYRIGISATPYKSKGYEDIIDMVLGPTFHITKKEILRKEGWLIKPKVKIWSTGFEHDYFSTHKTNGIDCFVEGCNRDLAKRRHQNNYMDITNALVKDFDRNGLIANNVAGELKQGHCIVVLSKRLKHLQDIADMVTALMNTSKYNYQFTGKQTTQERMEIVKRADEGKCVLYSTIADEALDIPRLDRVHLAWPTRNTDLIVQQVGRIERPHKDKKDAIINDYLDDVGPLRSQLKERATEVYIKDKLTIEVQDESFVI